MNYRKWQAGFMVLLMLLLVAAQCGSPAAVDKQPSEPQADENQTALLNVVATTSIIADVVDKVGGNQINLSSLVPRGADPHTFEPTPQDVATVAKADVVFVNGLGLEGFLDDLIANAGGAARVVAVSEGVTMHQFEADDHQDEDEHAHEGPDPHVWMSPLNVAVFVQNIAQTLSEVDPENAAHYQENAQDYEAELTALDEWIAAQIEQIPPENRTMVTDHEAFGYFAERYDLTIVGAIIPASSTNASPSAQELAALQTAIAVHDVQAIFVSHNVNPTMAEQVAADMEIELVPLYAGSLGEPGSEAGSYLDFMRSNTMAIVEALSSSE